jgi:hypothetical protein
MSMTGHPGIETLPEGSISMLEHTSTKYDMRVGLMQGLKNIISYNNESSK